MPLIVAKTYDPAMAVFITPPAAGALAVVDSVNLRNVFSVPANGSVLVRIECAAAAPRSSTQAILFGVLQAGIVVLRKNAKITAFPTAAPGGLLSYSSAETYAVVSGLAPGAVLTWDAAVCLLDTTANTTILYGGPNPVGYGAFSFEIWTA